MSSEQRANAGFAILVAIVAASLIGIAQWRYAIFRNDVDLGIFTQVIAGIGHGFSSTAEGGTNHLLVHWSPIIVLAWPFLKLFGPLGLQIAQALLLAATLLPIWGLARSRFSPGAALAVAAVAAIYPMLCANAVGDFHEMAFVPLLSATFVYALDRRRWTLGVACALLLACTKEDQFVVLAFNGALCAAFGLRDVHVRRFGAIVALVGIAGAVLYFGIVRNVIEPHQVYSLRFFDWSHSPVSSATLTHAVESRAAFAFMLLVPLAFLPFVSRYGLFMIPGFVGIFASHEPVTLLLGTHYNALITGYALAAFVDGAASVAAFKPRLVAGVLAAAAAISIVITIWASPMEYWYYLYRRPNAHDAELERVLATLPRDADVGSEDEIFSHLGLDPNASIDISNQEWFVFDRGHYSDRWHFIDEPIVRRLLASRNYLIVRDVDGIVLIRRAAQRPGRT
jgi:uncharacterized membrane protein